MFAAMFAVCFLMALGMSAGFARGSRGAMKSAVQAAAAADAGGGGDSGGGDAPQAEGSDLNTGGDEDQSLADELLAQGIDVDDEGEVGEGEAEAGTEAVAQAPTKPSEDVYLRQFCEQAGINPSYLSRFTTTADAEAALEFLLQERAAQMQLQQSQPQPSAEPEYKFEIPDFNMPDVAPEFSDYLNKTLREQLMGLHGHYGKKLTAAEAELKAMREWQQSVSTDMARAKSEGLASKFETLVPSLGTQYESLLGKVGFNALAPGSQQHQNFKNLARETFELMKSGRSMERAIKLAAVDLFGDKVKEQVRQETAAAVQERKSQAIARPTQQKGGPTQVIRDPQERLADRTKRAESAVRKALAGQIKAAKSKKVA